MSSRKGGAQPVGRIRAPALARKSFPRFLLVGGSFALINAVLAAALTALLPLPAAVSAAIAWIACIPPAWICQRQFAFRGSEARRGGVLLYALGQGMGMTISSGAGGLFASGAFWSDLIVYLCASGLAAVASYALARRVIFKAPAAEPGLRKTPRAGLGD